MIRREVIDGGYEFNFVIKYPDEFYKENKKFPLIVLLHGAGERGNGRDELAKVEVHGFSKIFTEEKNYECALVMPQCEENSFWAARIQSIMKFTERIAENYPIDKDRIYLTGISMGGYGTWYTAMAYPDKFAAIAPCCGGGMPWNAGVLKMPVWAFHGSCDEVVAPYNSIDMVNAMKKFGYEPKLTVFEGVGHNSWDYTFDEELLSWLLQQKRK